MHCAVRQRPRRASRFAALGSHDQAGNTQGAMSNRGRADATRPGWECSRAHIRVCRPVTAVADSVCRDAHSEYSGVLRGPRPGAARMCKRAATERARGRAILRRITAGATGPVAHGMEFDVRPVPAKDSKINRGHAPGTPSTCCARTIATRSMLLSHEELRLAQEPGEQHKRRGAGDHQAENKQLQLRHGAPPTFRSHRESLLS
jgi:hypothetical protein